MDPKTNAERGLFLRHVDYRGGKSCVDLATFINMIQNLNPRKRVLMEFRKASLYKLVGVIKLSN